MPDLEALLAEAARWPQPDGVKPAAAPADLISRLAAAAVAANQEALTAAMGEYARAIRGDWSAFDGRTERDVIESWVAEMVQPTATTLPEWRDRLGICPDGNGHWAGMKWGHCQAETCPLQAERESALPRPHETHDTASPEGWVEG